MSKGKHDESGVHTLAQIAGHQIFGAFVWADVADVDAGDQAACPRGVSELWYSRARISSHDAVISRPARSV